MKQVTQNQSPNPSIGQHFLINPRILNLIASQVPDNSDVIELGAGLGQLTEKLVKAAKNITAIEIDDRFFDSLDGLIRPFPKLKIHIGDILKFDFGCYPLPWIVGNIPYHITEPLLHKLIKKPIAGCTLLVGDKFAYEATTTDSSSEYFGKLSFLVNTFFTAEIVTFVERSEFNPPPRTRSALIKLIPRPQTDYSDRGLFLSRLLFMTASHSPLIKNALMEGLVKFGTSSLTKNEARKVVTELGIPDAILYTSFEHLKNSDYQILSRLLK